MDLTDEPLGLATEEHTCRICQLEATEDRPLFHPCKCRGSIKYIHQDCLEEWLKRSGRDGRCDICHEAYKFTTVYLENTPGVAPFGLILLKTRSHIVQLVKYITAYTTLSLGILQIPLFWALSRRFIDWMIDGNTTHDDFFASMLYGNITFEGDPYSSENLLLAFKKTFFPSLTFLLLFVAAHLFLFLEHEWVSKDSGFQKLVRKNIGNEHAFVPENNLNEPAGPNANAGLNPGVRLNQRHLENLQRVLREAAEHRNNNNIGDAILNNDIDAALQLLARREEQIRRMQQFQEALEADNRRNLINHELLEEEDEDDDPDFDPMNDEASSEESDGEEFNAEQEMAEFQRFARFHANEPQEPARPNIANQVPDIPNIPNARVEAFPPFPAPIRPVVGEARRAEAAPNIPPQPRPAQNEFADALDAEGDFILSLPIFLIIVVADCFLGAYLICIYLIPSLLGTLIFQSGAIIFFALESLTWKTIVLLKVAPFFNKGYNLFQISRGYFPSVDSTLNEHVITPLLNAFTHVYEQKEPLTKLERLIPLGIFYGLMFSGILLYLKTKASKHNDQNPLRGLQRRIYVILFDFVSTLKVFLIFFTELFIFPTYCGTLLEFVLTPLFDLEARFILNNIQFVKDSLIIRLFISWAVGTLYMCLFAIFVGMCRRYILRPGLLFFIRSPEDQNARLVHDALVRPLTLQMSRIGLSGLVYTLFILIGFGVFAHGLKAVGTPLLPVELNIYSYEFFYGICIALVALSSVYHRLETLKRYVRQYWGRSFKIASAKTRLSSFILGIHDPRERGYVVYRDLSARLHGAKPDYTKPISIHEANEIFKATDIKACFVPDGNLVRAPRNDTVSRKFLRNLFIPVTKDDIPLQTEEELKEQLKRRTADIDDFDESEDELTTTNNYEIVYRPPMFGARVIAFILILWIFSVILIGGVAILANIIGKPCLLVFDWARAYFSYPPEDNLLKAITEKGLIPSILRMNIACTVIGVGVLAVSLDKYDKYLIKNHIGEEDDDGEDDGIQGWPAVIRHGLGYAASLLIYFTSNLYVIYWNNMVHEQGINRPLKYHFGVMEGSLRTLLTYGVHAIAGIFTYLSYYRVVRGEPFLFRDRDRDRNIRDFALIALKRALERFVSTHLVVMLVKVSIGLYEYWYHPENYTGLNAALYYVIVKEGVHKDLIIYSWPITLATVGCVLASTKTFEYFQKINAEVKEEFYSRGKTLENIGEVVEETTDELH